MKQQSGFTLIELVIVIIVLGILAATAVPKFVDLQGDARASAMNGVKGALEGAATLTYSKAAIDGVEDEPDDTANGVATVYGYPAANEAALEEAAELSDADWDITQTEADGTGTATIVAAGEAVTGCRVTYLAATATARPVISVAGCS